MLRIHTLAALAVLLWPAALFAESACEKDPHNALAELNCGFTKNTDGWETKMKKVTLKSVDGALEVKSVDGVLTMLLGPCADVVELATYTGSVRMRAVKGDIGECRLWAEQFSATGCKGDEAATFFNAFLTPGPDWQTASDTMYMSPPAGSVRMRLECASGPNMTVQFDDVSLSIDPETLPASGTSTTTSTAW